eukprot:2638370-Rhodomonas_salina.1
MPPKAARGARGGIKGIVSTGAMTLDARFTQMQQGTAVRRQNAVAQRRFGAAAPQRGMPRGGAAVRGRGVGRGRGAVMMARGRGAAMRGAVRGRGAAIRGAAVRGYVWSAS